MISFKEHKQDTGGKQFEREDMKDSIDSLWEKIRGHLETRINLFKLKAIDKASDIVSSVISMIIVFTFLLIFIVLINISIALYLGDVLGKAYYGFLIVAGFYGIIGLVFYAGRNKILKNPIINSLVKKLMD